MSMEYSIQARLEAIYSKKNIQELLNTGKCLDFFYYKYTDEDIDKPLSLDSALQEIFYVDQDTELHCLTTQYGEVFFTLHIYNKEDNLFVMFSGMSSIWSKNYKGCYSKHNDIDINKYIQLFLSLIGEFKIKLMIIENS